MESKRGEDVKIEDRKIFRVREREKKKRKKKERIKREITTDGNRQEAKV